MVAWLVLIVLVASGFLLVGRHDAFIVAGMNAADLAMTASAGLLVMWLSGALLPQLRDTHPRSHRWLVRAGSMTVLAALLLWLHAPLVALGSATWSAWGRNLPLPRIVADTVSHWQIAPAIPSVVATGERSVRLRRRPDGHFHAAVRLNEVPASLLVDSGATAVVLKASHARDAGIDPDLLSYSVPIETAGGAAFAARIRLRRLQLGNIVIEDVEALVARPGALENSLLGSSFLSRLRSYEISGAFMTLRG